MKRIILGISILLMLVQNGFAKSDAEWDKKISEQTSETWKQIYHCDKAANNNRSSANVNICFKAIDLMQSNPKEGGSKSICLLNIGTIYYGHDNKLNAYKYWMKAAKLGDIQSQKNLDIMCKQSPWACK